MRVRSLQEVLAALRADLEADGVDVNALDQGSGHPYRCTCETCWRWWKQLGLGDELNPPFTQAQIDCETYEEACKGASLDFFLRSNREL